MKLLTRLTPLATLFISLAMVQSAQAENKEDKLTFTGFVDMSYLQVETDNNHSEHDFNVDQVEIDFAYDFGNKLTANVDVEYQNNDEGVDIEQAFISYQASEQFSVKAGRFLSYSGWETEEPTGLFQYSGTGYAPYFYGYYQQGISGLYTGEGFSAAVSLVSALSDPQSSDFEDVGVETMLAIMPTDEVTIKGFYSFEPLAGTDETTTLVNLWASYSFEQLTLAAEYNQSENAPAYALNGAGINAEATGYLLMANYAFDSFAFTVRYHDWQIESASGAMYEDASGFTLSPSYSVNDNLLLVFEYRMDEINKRDVDAIALEALVTF